MYEKFFSQRLTKLRMEKNVSARDMSLSIGQGAGYINNIENGHNLPSMTGFFYICEYLNITPKDFFDENNANPIILNKLIDELKKLNSNQLESILSIVKDLKK